MASTSVPGRTEYVNGSLQTTTSTTEILQTWNGSSYSYSPGKTTTRSTQESRRVSSRYYSKDSVSTPNFRSIVKTSGLLPTNGFAVVSRTTIYPMGSMIETVVERGIQRSKTTYVGSFGSRSPSATTVALPTTTEFDRLDAEVRNKLLLAVKEQSVSIAQIFAERDKTAASVSKIVATIAEIIRKLRKGDLAGAGAAAGKHVGWKKRKSHSRQHQKDPAGAMSNAWLEFQYAIMPLLLDAQGLAVALAQYQTRPITGRVQASRKIEIDKSSITGSVGVGDGMIIDRTKGFVAVKYTVFYRVLTPALPSFAGIGLTNPAQLAWELAPFSFIVDWLLPIGDYLSTFDATVGMQFSDGSKSTKTKVRRTMTQLKRLESRSANRVDLTEWDLNSGYEIDEVVRVKLTSFPRPGIPFFKDPTSLKHLATSMALLYKAIRS